MTYYSNSAYKERWYIRFMDLKGGSWRVSIEDPTFTGTSTELTASANPLEWMGTGDDDKTKVIQGSTGTLRIMVEDESDIVDLIPTELNNRRVKVTRDNVLLWLGFLKQEEYNQEWIGAPYEVELPIVSALELTKDIRILIKQSSYIGTIASLLKQCVESMGVSVDIFTNMQMYVESRGYKINDNWTSARMQHACLYSDADKRNETRYVSEMLEMVAAPLGHIREYRGDWYILLDQNAVEYTYQMNTQTYTTTNLYKLNEQEELVASGNMLSMTDDDINIEGTDNTISILPAPSEVEVAMSVDDAEDVIFETNEEKIQDRIPGTSVRTEGTTYYSEFDIESQEFAKGTGRTRPMFRRIVKYENNKFSNVLPLGFVFGGEDDRGTSIFIRPINEAMSISGVSKIRLEIKMYYLSGEKSSAVNQNFYIKVGQYWLTKENGVLTWKPTRTVFNNAYFNIEEVGTLTVDFNEFRTSSDLEPKKIELEVYSPGAANDLITVKFEYIYDNNLSSAIAEMNKGIDKPFEQDRITCNGSGDALKLSYYTLRGLYPLSVSSNFAVVSAYPRNGFYDKATPDTGTRTMIDISEASNEQFALDCLYTPARVTMSGKTYNAVAVGCNARDCTMSLKLIQTNI